MEVEVTGGRTFIGANPVWALMDITPAVTLALAAEGPSTGLLGGLDGRPVPPRLAGE